MRLFKLPCPGSWHRLSVVFVLLVMMATGLFAQSTLEEMLSREGFGIAEGRPEAPDFTLEVLGGGETSLSSFRGKVVFLNFWATWCGPCRVEMPSMDQLYNEVPRDYFEILAVDLRESPETVTEFVEELGLTFPILLDSRGTIGATYGVRGIPTTFLIDKEGRLVGRLVGSRQWDTDDFIEVLNYIIKE